MQILKFSGPAQFFLIFSLLAKYFATDCRFSRNGESLLDPSLFHISQRKKCSFSFGHLFSKCDQICSFLRIWSHLLKKSLIENFIFCAVFLYRSKPTTRCFSTKNNKKRPEHPDYLFEYDYDQTKYVFM